MKEDVRPGHAYGATGTPSEVTMPDDEAVLTEADLEPTPQTEVSTTRFASIPGLQTVEYVSISDAERGREHGPDLFSHRGFHAIDERRLEPHLPTAARPFGIEEVTERARIPGEVDPGEEVLDVASSSVLLPRIEELNLSEAERTYSDPLHIMRGGPNMASK